MPLDDAFLLTRQLHQPVRKIVCGVARSHCQCARVGQLLHCLLLLVRQITLRCGCVFNRFGCNIGLGPRGISGSFGLAPPHEDQSCLGLKNVFRQRAIPLSLLGLAAQLASPGVHIGKDRRQSREVAFRSA